MTEKPAKTDCDRLVEVLYEYVDGDCDEALRQKLSEHVEHCPACLEQLGIEQQVRQLLQVRCAGQAPEGLRGRIVTALRSSCTTVTTVTTQDGTVQATEVTQTRVERGVR
ncbi:mycothiol system anti-sigma-R factor [Corynebacterium nuruki]|uniref:Mycothiol system anti-sigma-R factor n=1 Tax=Corynebacterium nuruki TaxID=1032851 RepID=A0A3D4SWB7_9CORY|nr:mycothiol system anti-sigma-R factor [Corynebacterium nuruki]HCT13291.1 mycothiol system anti-sigma-R factor [Corynebacterium nuruki]